MWPQVLLNFAFFSCCFFLRKNSVKKTSWVVGLTCSVNNPQIRLDFVWKGKFGKIFLHFWIKKISGGIRKTLGTPRRGESGAKILKNVKLTHLATHCCWLKSLQVIFCFLKPKNLRRSEKNAKFLLPEATSSHFLLPETLELKKKWAESKIDQKYLSALRKPAIGTGIQLFGVRTSDIGAFKCLSEPLIWRRGAKKSKIASTRSGSWRCFSCFINWLQRW